MFYDNPNLIKIDEKLYRYPNFVSPKKVKQINDIVKTFHRQEFTDEGYVDPIVWYKDKITPDIPELLEVWDQIGQFLAPEYVVHPTLHLQMIHPGDGGMFIHCDSPGEGNHEKLTQTDKWNTCCIIHYGLVVYFGEFEGGENIYPNQGIQVPVKPGDMVIHGAHSDYQHGVNEVTSGFRGAYANFVLPAEKNPGTFPPYGTIEDLERRSNLSDVWNMPVVKK